MPGGRDTRGRMTERIALLGVVVACFSVLLDVVAARPSSVAMDVTGVVGFSALALLNRHGWAPARPVLVLFADVLVFLSVALLGRGSGFELLFLDVAVLPFLVLDWEPRSIVWLTAALPVAGYFLLVLGGYEWFAGWHRPLAYSYGPYSALVAFAGLIYGVASLVHENARSERALRASEERQRLVTDLARDAILAVDERRMVRAASPAAVRLFGRPSREIVEQPLATFVTGALAIESAFAQGFSDGEARRPDGSAVPVELSVGELSSTTPALRTVIVRDVSERVTIQRSLDEARARSITAGKMAALGEMSGGIAYEISNPLTAANLLIGRLDRALKEDAVSPELVREVAGKMRGLVRRIARVVQGLRTFAHEERGEPFVVAPVARILDDTLVFCLERFLRHGIDVRVEPIPPSLTIECRPVLVSRLLLNVLMNAFDAVEKLDDKWVRLDARAVGDDVELSITDSGPGIAPGLRERIFQPFVTTKRLEEGSGLGLSVASGLATTHHGRLVLDESSPHTRFVLTLPREQPAAPAQPMPFRSLQL